MKFHVDGTIPAGREIFVFGSNMLGRHGAGAAKVARERFGMTPGAFAGPWGRCYAIPTKDDRLVTLKLNVIESYVHAFLDHARSLPEDDFFVTRIGCGLAGYRDEQIAPMFRHAPTNCTFAEAWKPHLEG